MAIKQIGRIIMRLEVRRGTPEALDAATKEWASTHLSVASRAVEWLCQQDDGVQAMILGLYPMSSDTNELARLILKRMKDRR
jgi:hypothetical protein